MEKKNTYTDPQAVDNAILAAAIIVSSRNYAPALDEMGVTAKVQTVASGLLKIRSNFTSGAFPIHK